MVRPIYAPGLVVLGLLTGLPASARERDAEVPKAIAYVEKWQGRVEIDRDSPDKPVIGVDLVGCKLPEGALGRLLVFTKLQRLNLGQTAIGDAELAPLKRFTSLEQLELSGTSITDKGLGASRRTASAAHAAFTRRCPRRCGSGLAEEIAEAAKSGP